MRSILLLAPRGDGAPGALDAALTLVLTDSGLDAVVASAFEGAPAFGGPWTHAVDITHAETGELLPWLETVRPALAGAVDPGSSTIAVGDDVLFFGSPGSIRIFYAVERAPDLTFEAFVTVWRDEHIKYVTDTDRASYTQVHVDVEASARSARAAGLATNSYDGIALPTFASDERLLAAVTVNHDPAEDEHLQSITRPEKACGVVLRVQ
ncbi:MAG: hypothetical protein JWL73_2491 [Actinomycetia bacterium]|nr:hypothetical protein [Actinomycetes bacterium]